MERDPAWEEVHRPFSVLRVFRKRTPESVFEREWTEQPWFRPGEPPR
jgi:hypothetical protein